MNTQTILTFSAIAGLAILSPGPSILLAVRNGASFGARSVIWSALGNISGIFCVSTAAIFGLGVLLKSSALLFVSVKLIGALYLFYVGVRQLFGRAAVLAADFNTDAGEIAPSRRKLYREAFLVAATNPKAILFFTALFPQFISAQAPLIPQFLVLTAIFMTLSYVTHLSYALVVSRARSVLQRPLVTKWINRVVGAVFISFGALMLSLRRQAA